MSNFRFDEATHTYYLDGVKIPSVTQILKPLYDFSAVHPDVLRRAGEFGTACHKAIELYLKDDLDEDCLDKSLEGPLLAFKAWQMDTGWEFLDGSEIIEQIGYHSRLKYAGTPDISTQRAVIDLKSRPANLLTDSLQLAAYDHMTGNGRRERYVLELKQDGSYIFTLLNPTTKTLDTAWSRFRYLMDYHSMSKEITRWKTK